jgi:endonuclease YncB( thermonuclease family)
MNNLETEFKAHGIKTPYFSLKDYETFARVVSVHDGDTMTVVFPIFGSYHKFSVRLGGIDTCEMLSTNAKVQEKAVQARQRLIELVTGQDIIYRKQSDVKEFFDKNVCVVWLKCGPYDKYGRLLADVKKYNNSAQTFSQILESENLAYHYTGGKKLTEEQQAVELYV